MAFKLPFTALVVVFHRRPFLFPFSLSLSVVKMQEIVLRLPPIKIFVCQNCFKIGLEFIQRYIYMLFKLFTVKIFSSQSNYHSNNC